MKKTQLQKQDYYGKTGCCLTCTNLEKQNEECHPYNCNECKCFECGWFYRGKCWRKEVIA